MLINIYGNYKIVLLLGLSSALFAFRHCSSNKHNITKQCNSIISSCVWSAGAICVRTLFCALFTCLGTGRASFRWSRTRANSDHENATPHPLLHWPNSLHTTLCAVHRIDDNFNYYHISQKGKHETRASDSTNFANDDKKKAGRCATDIVCLE